MSSHDKRHGGYRGGVQGHGRHGDGFGDASGFMDETDREVSSLTDRAFRSLCIGEEAVYNDSSPVERHKAFADEARSHEAVKAGVAEPYGEAAGTWGAAPMLQRFVMDEAAAKQEHHALAGDCVSHHSNGVIEATWQQKRTSSLIGAFGAAEYDGNGGVAADAAVTSQDSVYQHGGDPWGSSALLSIQKELSEFSSVYHQSIRGSALAQNRDRFHSSEVAAAPQTPSNAESSVPSSTFLKSSSRCSSSFKTPSTRNFFLHSEFSPFQTWKEYNRLLYDRDATPHVPSTSQSPRWYDSPFYRELTVAHRAQMVQLEEQGSHRKQYDNVLPAEPPASTVRQTASAIEKRSESEVNVNCPPWKRRQEPVKNQNRPCTASPLSDKLRRKEDVLVSTGRASATNLKVQTVADEQTSNSGTPFSISQLLTPTIHPRQETETSEILQYALSPNVLDPPLSPESDPRPTPEIKPRNKYKAMASSLLFNLKDNRKRVKSTYTPTMFKSAEIADHSKQPSQLDSLTGKEGGVTSDTPLSWTGTLVRSNVMDLQSVNSPVAQNTKMHAVTYVRRTESSRSDDYLTLISPKTVREASSYRSFSHTPQESGSFRDRLAEGQGGRHVDSLFVASKSNETPGRKRPDPSSWKAGEFGSQREQDTKYKAPETQGLPQSFNKRDVPTSRVNEHVGNARTGEQYDCKLEADANLVKNNTSNERGVFQTEKVSMIGDIAALLERDRQLLEAQRGNTDKQNALVSGEKHSYKNEFFANTEKGNAKQDLIAIKEKQHTQNELFRKNEEIHPRNQVEVLRQNPYGPNEGLNRRQEYRHINQGLYDAQENYRDNLAASKGLHPTREIQYTPNEAFGRKEQAKQAVPVTRENKPVKNEFVVKEQDGIYLQGQARQRIPSRTDDRNGANYTFVINQHEKPAQDLSQRLPKDQKHPSIEAFAVTDLNPSKQVQAASEKNATLAGETANQVKQVLPSARGVRYAPIEEFARQDRELEKQRQTAGMGEAKHEPVKVQALIKQYEGSMGENRNGVKGLFATGEFKEIKGRGMQERYTNNVLSVTVPEQGKVLRAPLDGAAPSDAVEHHRRFNTDLSAASEWERSAKDLQLSRQSKPIHNEALSPKEHEAVPPREKAQTRQEILTSKLKAHAEKEIFAIKEKGHAQWEAHVTKQKEVYMHGSKEGEPLSAEHVTKNTVPVDGNRLAKQDSVAVRETHYRNGASVTQRDSPSAEHVKSVITGDGENRLAKPAATTREKEHSRNYIIAKTEKISIRQEELQSIARAKIEAIAGNRIHQPKRATEESSNAHQTSPSSRSKNAENITTAASVNVSQAEEEDANKKEGVHVVEERDRVKMAGLPESREHTRILGTAVDGTHEAKAQNVLLNKEVNSVSQAAFMSAEHIANEPEKQQVAGEIFSRREREGDTSEAPVNKEAMSSQHPIAEYIENKATANHEKHIDGASPVTIEKEHARNYLFVSEESVAVRPEVPPSLEHIRGKNTIANNETRLVREVIGAVEEDQDKNETVALHETNQVRLDSFASRKSKIAENDALGIKIRLPEEEVPPETNAKMEAITANQRQESARELANKDRGSVMHELPRSLETEKRASETLTVHENPPAKPVAAVTQESEDDKNDALAKEERISLKQEAPLLVQHGNEAFAVQESDVFKRVEKERAENVVQSSETDFLRQEKPSVEHIRIKIISHDEIPQVSESIFAIDSYSKHQTGSLEESQQVKLDSLASREREQAEHDRPRNTEGLGVKQEELPPVAHVESEVLAISESLQDKPEPENRHREHAEIEISQSVEKPDMKEEKNVVNDNFPVKPETVATKEVECARNDELSKKEKTSVGEDAPPSVEHIRIKIIPHDANQPVSEKIVSVENKSVSLHENHQFKLDSLQSGKSESPENNAAGIPERIGFELEELSPKTSAEAKAIAATQRHEATHEPVNKDRDTLVHERLQSVEKVNAATAFNENGLTEPEAVAPRETEGKRCDEERIDAREEVPPPVEYVAHEAAAEEETRGDEQGIAGTGQKDQAKSCAPVSKEKVSFKQDEPSVKHNRIQIVPVDETLQVRDSAVAIGKEHSIHETTERVQVELDSHVGTTNGGAEKNALGSRERVGGGQEEYPSLTINESNAVKENHRPENDPERMDRKGVVNQVPSSREEGSIKNETAEIDETHLPKPEVLATRETKDAKAESLAKKETVDLGWDVPLSLESPEEEAIQINENHPVILEVRDAGGKEHAKSDFIEEMNKRDTTVDKEKKRSDGQDEFSSVAHVKAGVKANHQPKHELASKVTDSVREELPQPTEDEKEITATLQKGGVVVNEKHKGKQEVLPTRKIEFAEDVLTNNKTDSVKREEKEHIQKETSSFNKNYQVSPGTPAGRREHSGSFEHANKEEVNAGEEERSSTQLIKTTAIGELHQAKQDLEKRDRVNVTQERAPAGEREYLGNKTIAVTENHLATQEVSMTREEDAKNAAVMNKGRDGVKVHVLPVKENERPRSVRSVTDKIHQAVLANRNGNSDSPPKIKSDMDESIAGGENHKHKKEVLSTRERAHAQNQPILFDENLKLKLEALARRRKEKVERYTRANSDGMNTRQGEHASTPRAKTGTRIVDKNYLAKHGLVIDDTGRITYGIPSREKENIRNVTTAASGSPLTKMEASAVSNKEHGEKDTLITGEAAGVRRREPVPRDSEHGQNEMLDIGDHQVKHTLENKQITGRSNRAPLRSESMRNESASASDNDQAKMEALAMSQKQDTRNFGVTNKAGDRAVTSKNETVIGSVNHKGNQGLLGTQVEKDSDRHGHTNTERIENRHDVVSQREKENYEKQVTEKEKQSLRMEMRSKEGEYPKSEVFPGKRSNIRRGELSASEKGPTILDYLLEKDRDRSTLNKYEIKEIDTIKQEVHATKDPTKKEVLALKKEELVKNEGFARRGNALVSNMATKDREVAENKESGGKEIDSVPPEVLVRKYEVPAENTFAVRDAHQTKQVTNEAVEPQKEELFSRQYQNLSENLKEHSAHKVLVTKDHPKLEATATTSSSKQEMVLTKEREPIRKELFAVKGKGETAVDRLSTKDTDYTKTKERAERGKNSNRQEVLMEQYQNLSENICIIQDKDLSKSAPDSMKEKEHSKQVIISSREDARRQPLAKTGNAHAKPEIFSAHENVHTHPEVYAITDKARYHSGKEALVSPQIQGYYSKHPMPVSDERGNSHTRNVVPRANSKMEMEALSNTQNEIKETLPLREKEREVIAMREHRAKERAVARQKQQHYEKEALPKQEYATYKTLPIKEKTDMRHELPPQFEKEDAKKEALANNLKDRTEIAARNQPNRNIEGQIIHEPHNRYTAPPSLPLQANGWRGAPVFSQPMGHINVPSRESYLTVGDASQSPEEEYKTHPSSRSAQSKMAKGPGEMKVVEEVKRNMGKPGEALQYYAINNHERNMETGDRPATSSHGHERTPRIEPGGLVHAELCEGGLAQSLPDYTKAQIPTTRSNTSSPSLGKPLFKVKDNSLRGSPMTKTVKPSFHKDDQRLGSSQENLSVLDQGDEERDHLREHVDLPALHNTAAASSRISRSRELPSQHSLPAPDFTTARAIQAHNILSTPEFTTPREQPAHSVVPTTGFISAREPRGYYRRNRRLDEDGRNSVVSTMSEDLESCGTSTYLENPCERPESACSDLRPLGKPPTVPPKSEKALRRAKRLTTRRIKKAEATGNVEGPGPSLGSAEHKPLRAVASMPSSPTEALASRRPAPAQPALPQYCVEPGYGPRAPSLVAQPFPLTQRKLLQDPNSGQFFMVDMPVQVKTKMFFDPETGKYVQLSVRQSPDGARSNASSVELLSPPPYVLYPGFLPVPVSSLPPLRSASQMSAPAALMEDQEKRSDPWRREAVRQNCGRKPEPYIEPAYRSHDQPAEKPTYGDERGCTSQRNLNIIPMGELEDFAMESA